MMTVIDKKILHIALPSIMSNITVPLLGLVDMAIVGHLGKASYIGAIAVGGMIFNVLYWLFGFLRMGTSGMTSQAYGERKFGEVMLLLQRSTTIGLLTALLFLIFQQPLLSSALFLIRPDAEVAPLVATYFRICIWGAPAMLSIYSMTGWFIGMQNTRIPMMIAIFQNIINILASLVLVYVVGMTIDGVALGTLIAQYAGCLMGMGLWYYYYYPHLKTHIHWQGFFRKKQMMSFFSVNRDIFLRTLCLVAVNLFFTSAGAAQGNIILAANTLLLQLFTLFSYIMDGFAYAGEALSGKYYGAKNKEAFDNTIRHTFLWGGFITLLFTLIYWIGGQAFLSLLTNDPTVLQASLPYLSWAILIPAAGVAAFIWDGVFIGITATRGMLISSALATLVFFGCYHLATSLWENHALWLAFILYLGSRSLVQTWLFRRLGTQHVESTRI